ncbi:SSU ribosomal protein S5p (S2e) [hydrothermal vent metagenome]|uniref:SSU ribosomal protein S5p (S2e) n=1 Tax=hydrothermal vent metagenome TaxID=652676 RepID=A0A3B1DKR5_9ZZZZ
MGKMMEDKGSQFETETLGIFRTAATVKGGRRFSFGALVVAGDRNGKVGYGRGKSKEVPTAIEKAEKNARKAIVKVPLVGSTIPHEVEGRFGASKVRLIPASPGTGVIAGGTVRTVLEAAGITDCLTKCYGSTNKVNMIRAVFDGISRLRTKENIEGIRDQDLGTTEIEAKIERGQRFMPTASSTEKMRGPVNTVGQDQRRGGRGGRGGGRGGGGGRGRGGYGGGAPAQQAAPATTPASAPPAPEAGSDKPAAPAGDSGQS